MEHVTFYKYLQNNGADLFTGVCLPCAEGKFPTVIYRAPYVDDEERMTEDEICAKRMRDYSMWVENGYAVVFQHCRGRGKSSGDCIPYIYEREDGLSLHEWVRKQSFYNGELYLHGGSYTAAVHYVTAPFADDIKGAILEIKDCERYNCNYRNGFYKMGLHGGWYVGMYKRKSMPEKNFTPEDYKTLPLSDFSLKIFGERAQNFDEILRHPDKDDPFWTTTRDGGGEAHNAIKHARIPILLSTGFYDTFTGGIFDMWRGLDDQTRSMSALAIHPFAHEGTGDTQPIKFENGVLREAFPEYTLKWLDSIRGKCEPPFERGKITYYKIFDNKWCCDGFYDADKTVRLPFGEGSYTYKYDPTDPAYFKGGLSANFGGTAWQNEPNSREDILTFYTEEFDKDTYIKGKMSARIRVKSDCEDTCFYMRVSVCKAEGDLGLRDDINKISNFKADYKAGQEFDMSFTFDEHAVVVKKGERLRIDISSSAFPHYIPHTNNRGLFSEQRTAKIANNTVILDGAYIEIPVLDE